MSLVPHIIPFPSRLPQQGAKIKERIRVREKEAKIFKGLAS
jgi:hypothetical protein